MMSVLYLTLIVIGNAIDWSNADVYMHIDTSELRGCLKPRPCLRFRIWIVLGLSDSTLGGWYFQSTFMIIDCLLIVLCIRGLPSRIFNAAHTSKFITPMTGDVALPTKHGLSESFNRLTGLRSPLKKQHKLGFSQIQLWQFQDQNYGSTTSKSVIQSTYYNSWFSEIRIWISVLLVDWSDQLPNWLRRWVFDNRSELDYGLDGRNSVAHHYN